MGQVSQKRFIGLNCVYLAHDYLQLLMYIKDQPENKHLQTRTRLNQQGANFQQEIRKVTDKIVKERENEAKLVELQEERERGEEMAAEAKRAEDKILRGYYTAFSCYLHT